MVALMVTGKTASRMDYIFLIDSTESSNRPKIVLPAVEALYMSNASIKAVAKIHVDRNKIRLGTSVSGRQVLRD